MKFSQALELALDGQAIAREGNYDYDRIYLVKGSMDPAACSVEDSARSIEEALAYVSSETSDLPLKYFEAGDENTATRLPRFDAKDCNGNTVVGWTPKLVDMLAEDWDLAENVSIPFDQEFGAEEAA